MSPRRKRKCLHCQTLFHPDPRNTKRQRYCSSTPCRQASKTARQQRWLDKPENRDYFRGHENVRRVQAWREAHPGYSQRTGALNAKTLQDDSLAQTVDCRGKTGTLTGSPLQDLLSQQVPVLLGLIASLSGLSLQDDIASTIRRLLTLGVDILNHPDPQGDDHHATQTPTLPSTPAPHSLPVQLDRSALGT